MFPSSRPSTNNGTTCNQNNPISHEKENYYSLLIDAILLLLSVNLIGGSICPMDYSYYS
jgi:hypothetical protein